MKVELLLLLLLALALVVEQNENAEEKTRKKQRGGADIIFDTNRFNKEIRCHSAFGQIQDIFKKENFIKETFSGWQGERFNEIELPIDVNNLNEAITKLLEYSSYNPTYHIFILCTTISHSFELQINNNKIRILSSWEGDYCYKTYARRGKYGRFTSEPQELIDNLILFFKKQSVEESTNQKELTDLYTKLFGLSGRFWGRTKMNKNGVKFILSLKQKVIEEKDEEEKEYKKNRYRDNFIIGSFLFIYKPQEGGKRRKNKYKKTKKRKK